MNVNRLALGIDFGATYTKMGVISATGAIQTRTEFLTPEHGTQAEWLDAAGAALACLLDRIGLREDQLEGVGIGVPGFVDHARGYIHELPNVPGWEAVDLARLLRKRFGLRSLVDNDVNMMALGECLFGAGHAYKHAVFLTLGTGVGGGLLLDGRLYRGAYSLAGEIGHMPIEREGIASPQGRGGLEQYVGNRQIVERALAGIRSGRASDIPTFVAGPIDRLTPKEIAMAAAAGDPLAKEIFEFVADCLATALAGVTYLLQPEAFIIGGGVAASGSVLFEPLERRLRARLSSTFAERVALRPAQLGNDAGLIGAGTMVFNA